MATVISSLGFAQTAYKGVVMSSKDNTPVSGASIVNNSTKSKTIKIKVQNNFVFCNFARCLKNYKNVGK
jgi:hypothetical protein